MNLFILTLLLNTTYPKTINNCEISNNIVNSIIGVETNNRSIIGDNHLINDYSVGVGQIRLSTAKWMIDSKIIKGYELELIKDLLKYDNDLTQWLLIEEINKIFIINYLQYICRLKKGDFKQTIIAYNTGPNAKQSVISNAGKRYFNKFLKIYNKISK